MLVFSEMFIGRFPSIRFMTVSTVIVSTVSPSLKIISNSTLEEGLLYKPHGLP